MRLLGRGVPESGPTVGEAVEARQRVGEHSLEHLFGHAFATAKEADGSGRDAGMRRQCALAVSRDGLADLFDQDNTRLPGPRVSIEQALESDLPFFVRVRSDVLAVDFDSDGGADPVRAAHAACARLLVRGHRPVLLASGRDGHRHLYARVDPGAPRYIAQELGLNSGERRDTIRPPLTKHRHGRIPSLILPTDPEAALRALRGHASVRVFGASGRAALNRARPFDSDSELINSLALAAVNAGWTVDDFLMVLTSDCYPVCNAYRRRVDGRGEQAAEAWVRHHVWPSAARRCAQIPPQRPGANLHGEALVAWALDRPWPGRSGPADWSVYLALVVKYRAAGVTPFNASERELEELAGISSRGTVQGALNRLVANGLLERVGDRGPVAGRRSTQWSLPDPSDLDGNLLDPKAGRVLMHLGHDVFRNRVGLGRRAAMICMTLAVAGTMPAEEIAQRVGSSPRATQELVRRLVEFGVLSQGPTGYLFHEDRLELASHLCGATGRGERQSEQHARERNLYDSWRGQDPPSAS